MLTNGAVFEKAGVNTSTVYGELPAALAERLEGDGTEFWATGISLVLHPINPHVPTTHANFRYIERGGRGWFGGGADLTPYVLYEDDAAHFHRVLRDACDRHDPAHYPRFKTWCDDYFYLPHRGEARGIGGLFFDYLHTEAAQDGGAAVFDFWCDLGEAFVPSYLPIAQRRKDLAFDDALLAWQQQRRGRYVEFNLVYDRGTLFGLKTNGRIESILMSLPPVVRWDYDVQAAPGTYQEALIEALRSPRDWA